MGGSRDGVRGIAPVSLFEPLSHVAGGNSAPLDTVDGQSATILVQTGDTVDNGATFSLEESDAPGGPWTAVDAELDQIGDVIPTPLLVDTVYRAGYVGNKKLVRAVLTIPGATKLGVTGQIGWLNKTPQPDLT